MPSQYSELFRQQLSALALKDLQNCGLRKLGRMADSQGTFYFNKKETMNKSNIL